MLEQVLEAPQQVIEERGGRKAYQSQVAFEGCKLYLLRAIVLDSIEPGVLRNNNQPAGRGMQSITEA